MTKTLGGAASPQADSAACPRRRLAVMLAIAAPALSDLSEDVPDLLWAAEAPPTEEARCRGSRATAVSGKAWNSGTVVRALVEVSEEVEPSGLGEGELTSVRITLESPKPL